VFEGTNDGNGIATVIPIGGGAPGAPTPHPVDALGLQVPAALLGTPRFTG
jgi:hypothetical protein